MIINEKTRQQYTLWHKNEAIRHFQLNILYNNDQNVPGNAEMKSRCSIGRRNSSTSPCWWWHIRWSRRSTKCTCSDSDQPSKYSRQMRCCSSMCSGRAIDDWSPKLSSSIVILVWLTSCVYRYQKTRQHPPLYIHNINIVALVICRTVM